MKEMRKMNEEEMRQLIKSYKAGLIFPIIFIIIFPIYFILILMNEPEFELLIFLITMYSAVAGFIFISYYLGGKKVHKDLNRGIVEVINGPITSWVQSPFKIKLLIEGEIIILPHSFMPTFSEGDFIEIVRAPISNTTITVKANNIEIHRLYGCDSM